ncbi:MAG: hypothetical protein IPK83_06925 [Planctomycetes bacterium]|nr:hypothetical protein [Planctomycetota bacterium]
MSTFPTGRRSDFLRWAQAHAPVWEANAGDIGLTVGQAEAFGIAVIKLANEALALEEARQAYLAAAVKTQASYRVATREASEAVRLIRAYGGAAKNPLTVYNAAQIAPPAAKSKAPPPSQPERLAAALGANDGSLTLTWKCSNPAGTSGTSYIVRRRLGPMAVATESGESSVAAAVRNAPSGTGAGHHAGSGPARPGDMRMPTRKAVGMAPGATSGESAFTILGIVGKKTFVDDDLPAGVESVEYTIQGQRADRRGAVSPILTVNFGTKAAGAMRAKMAGTGSAATLHAAVGPSMKANALVSRSRAGV